MSSSDDVVAFVMAHGPVVASADLSQRFSPAAVRWALRRGDILRVGHGRYAVSSAGSTCEPNAEEALAVALRGAVSHLSAASAWGLSLWRNPSVVTVTVPRGSRAVPTDGVRLVRWTLDVAELAGTRTSLERTVLDCAGTLPAMEALAVVDSALREDRLTYRQLQALALEYRAATRCRTRARWFAMLGDARAANPLESAVRALALDAGLAVEPQVWIGDSGTRGRVDLVDRRRRIAIEVDGHEHHSSRADWARDVHRTTSFTADGWVVVRFTWDDLRRRPAWVRSVLRRVRARQDGRADA